MYENTVTKQEIKDTQEEMFDEFDFNGIMAGVIETAKLILNGEYRDAIEYGTKHLRRIPEMYLQQAATAMLTEEVNAKRGEEIAETFENIVDLLIADRAEYIPADYRAIVDIVVNVTGWEVDAIEWFIHFKKVVGDVTEQCGVYEGGF